MKRFDNWAETLGCGKGMKRFDNWTETLGCGKGMKRFDNWAETRGCGKGMKRFDNIFLTPLVSFINFFVHGTSKNEPTVTGKLLRKGQLFFRGSIKECSLCLCRSAHLWCGMFE